MIRILENLANIKGTVIIFRRGCAEEYGGGERNQEPSDGWVKEMRQLPMEGRGGEGDDNKLISNGQKQHYATMNENFY